MRGSEKYVQWANARSKYMLNHPTSCIYPVWRSWLEVTNKKVEGRQGGFSPNLFPIARPTKRTPFTGRPDTIPWSVCFNSKRHQLALFNFIDQLSAVRNIVLHNSRWIKRKKVGCSHLFDVPTYYLITCNVIKIIFSLIIPSLNQYNVFIYSQSLSETYLNKKM